MAGKAERELKDTPADNAIRWDLELEEARAWMEEAHWNGDVAVDRYLDVRPGAVGKKKQSRVNVHTANVQTQQAVLMGKTPQVSVERRFADAKDDPARVGGDILQRMLNCDIERTADGYVPSLQGALNDFLLPGLACVRLRYEPVLEQAEAKPAKKDKAGKELAPAVEAHEEKVDEDAPTVYVYWRDLLYSPCRVWQEARWVAFGLDLTRKQCVSTFGKEHGSAIPLVKRSKTKGGDDSKDKVAHPQSRARVWEIWDKEAGRVFHHVEGYGVVLTPVDVGELANPGGGYDDPLGLEGFFPCPEPMVANVTTKAFRPTTDYHLARDLYEEVDVLSTRIRLLIKAVRVVGVYDKSSTEVKAILTELAENQMIPAVNWGKFAEKGGIDGVVSWFPIEQVVKAVVVLRQERAEAMALLDQVTGKSDLQRGQQTNGDETATAAGIKAKFGSVRLTNKQDRFAKFASDTQNLRAEIISKHFDVETIKRRANVEQMQEDPTLIAQGLELLKSGLSKYRIAVKPENVSLTDFAQLKTENMELMQALSVFFQAMIPVAQAAPPLGKHLLRIAQGLVAGLRGASTIEGVLDQAVTEMEQAEAEAKANPKPPPADPKVVAQQMKMQGDLAKVQAELQADLVRTQVEVQADAQREQNQMVFNVQEARAKGAIAAQNQAMRPQPKPGRPGGAP